MPNRQTTRAARREQLAQFIKEAFTEGKKELPLVEILPRFSGEASFARLSSLHAFVDHQYLTAPHPGSGGHHPRIIHLNTIAKRYADEALNGATNDSAAIFDGIPDGTPIGDPIFSSVTTR